MHKIEIDLFMLTHLYLPLFGFAFGGAFLFGALIGFKTARKYIMEEMEHLERMAEIGALDENDENDEEQKDKKK